MKGKWKILAAVASMAMVAALVSGATMAWFTSRTNTAAAKFTAGTVKIQAGQTVVEDSAKKYYEEVPPKANQPFLSLQNYEVKKQKDGTDVDSSRSDPETVLDQTGASGDGNFLSLGYGGWVVVELNEPVSKGDLLVVETTRDGSTSSYVEQAEVYVSPDGSDWTYAGQVDNQQSPRGNFHRGRVSSPVSNVRFVKIADSTPRELDGKPNESEDGYDVDYVFARQILDEGNWNPGDTNRIAFFLNNVGTKDIVIRAKLDSHWENPNGSSFTPDPDEGVVSIEIENPEDGWVKGSDGYYYYVKSGTEYQTVRGTYGGENEEAKRMGDSAELKLKISLDGAKTGNQYQGKKFVVTPTFQAVQASHSFRAEAGGWTWESAFAQ